MIALNFVLAALLLNLALFPVFLLAGRRLRLRMHNASQAMREAKAMLRPLEARASIRSDGASELNLDSAPRSATR
jgi:hypothetical protein